MGLCGSTTAGIDEEAGIAAGESKNDGIDHETPVLKARHSESTANSTLSSQLEMKDEADSMCLLTIPFFADLDKKHLRDLRSLFTRKVFKKDEIVVAEGTGANGGTDAANTFHVVISGRVRLCARDAKDATVSLSELTHGWLFSTRPSLPLPKCQSWYIIIHGIIHETGDWFGEMAAIQNHVQPVTAQALEDNTGRCGTQNASFLTRSAN
jgi:CRP-like cAMP-binding protein